MGRSSPRVSVITPAYQASGTIGRAVRSVLSQTFADWEMVVVDDGSTDGTADAAAEASTGDPRIRVVAQENAGAGVARNRGLAVTTGSKVIFLDADDELFPDYIASQLHFAEEYPEAAIVGCNVVVRSPAGDRLWLEETTPFHHLTLQQLLTSNTISVMALVDRDAVNAVGAFRPVYTEDYDLWIRMLAQGFTHAHNPRILGRYYRTHGSKSSDRVKEWTAVRSLLQEHREAGLFDSSHSDAARRSESRFTAMISRVELEQAIMAGRHSDARSSVWLARESFSRSRYFLAAILMTMFAPRSYRTLILRRSTGYSFLGRTEPDQ